eukprot:508538_1
MQKSLLLRRLLKKRSIFHCNYYKWYNSTNTQQEFITLKWIKDGDPSNKITTTNNVPIGISILEAAHANDIDLEGACESSLACSTCHVILDDDIYDKLNEPEDEEYDMLDLAFGLTETSRLGCQIILDQSMDNMTITLPSATRNFYVDGHKPEPH